MRLPCAIRSMLGVAAALALVPLALAARGNAEQPPLALPSSEDLSDDLAGDRTTVANTSPNAYGHALANMDPERWIDLREGKALFTTTWVAPGGVAETRAALGPASRVREGLGPRFNATSCQSCHFKDGRGRPPRERDKPGPPRLLRLGLAGPDGRLLPEPTYGGQLQDHALPSVAPEGTFDVIVRRIEGRYPDNTPFTLEEPTIRLRDLSLGPLHPGSRLSLRMPPSLVGLGLLEAVPEEVLLAGADPDDLDGDGISGRPNRAPDPRTGRVALGRFGWKASQPSLLLQTATALREDLGVSSPVFPDPPCAPGDTACASAPLGPSSEISADDLDRLTSYTRLLAPPARRDAADPEVARGKAIFAAAGCASCHLPRLETGDVPDLPELGRQTIHPYTDLLLHDMGEALSDDRPDGEASGKEWRTAPLWGLGLLRGVSEEVRLLHDGRANSAEEAILWHGGEAKAARDAFARSPREDRRALLRFLDSL